MIRLVECVPNFSEGRRKEVLDQIINEITSVESVVLLDREMDFDHNRAVVTFVCPPEAAVEACFRGIKKASEVLDMTTHKGEHPRMGATDVCPFIPISDFTEAEAKELAHQLGKRVGEELQIPVYLYESAATTPERQNLAVVRKGEYEGIRDSIETDPSRKPDYGPSKMNLKAGATAIGVRFPLVAYNVYLNTNRVSIAKKIANAVRDARGGYRFVKAMGFSIKERNLTQVSMNLVRYTKTPIFRVFETIKSEAARYGVSVLSSEIIGLIPQQALLDVADFYLQLENFSSAQVLEEKLRQMGGTSQASTSDFYNEVAAKTATPGGGSVAAAAGTMGAALASMVCRLTIGKKKYKDVADELNEVLDKSEKIREQMKEMIVKDGEAFELVMSARKMPKDTDDEIAKRNEAIFEATKGAARTPLETAGLALKVMELARVVAEKGNVNSVSDAGVAALMAKAAIEGAIYNVKINIGGFEDKDFVDEMTKKVGEIKTASDKLADEIRNIVEGKI
ncbi:MAG: glutamate formimidoyltransferase [Candidatus Zixiibacteriota bacterium]|nr:MAG: glutamate formimidoyltransferase [candidate division Zixibacteria bacterium]HDL02564.1 glutamate formimidoyltransferase [candidate division Zixibacteria bacterium]